MTGRKDAAGMRAGLRSPALVAARTFLSLAETRPDAVAADQRSRCFIPWRPGHHQLPYPVLLTRDHEFEYSDH